MKENDPITFLKYANLNSSFIQPFGDDVTTHRCLYHLLNVVASCLAPWKTITGLNFMLSAFAVKHTMAFAFSLPVNLRGISFAPVVLTTLFPTMSNEMGVSFIPVMHNLAEIWF